MIKKILISIYAILISPQVVNSQSLTTSLSDFSDSIIGKENLNINNGFIANEQYYTLNKSSIYFKDSKFSLGSVFYENQLYGNLPINYDTFNDQLLLRPNGNDDLKSVIVKKEYASYFILLDKKFVNLNNAKKTNENFLNGYFEEIIISKNLVLYIKNSKTKSDKIENNRVVIEFTENKQFVIFFNEKFYKFNQNTVEELFPDLKNQIKTFYSDNLKLQKSDEQHFIEKLLKQINTLFN